MQYTMLIELMEKKSLMIIVIDAETLEKYVRFLKMREVVWVLEYRA